MREYYWPRIIAIPFPGKENACLRDGPVLLNFLPGLRHQPMRPGPKYFYISYPWNHYTVPGKYCHALTDNHVVPFLHLLKAKRLLLFSILPGSYDLPGQWLP